MITNDDARELNTEELKDVDGGKLTPIEPKKKEDIKPIPIDPSPEFIREDI